MVNPFLETGLFGVEEMEDVEKGVDDGVTDTFASPDLLEFVESPAGEAEVGGDLYTNLDDVESLEGGQERGYNS